MSNGIALTDVHITDGFFSRYASLVRTEVIPYQWAALNDNIPGAEKSGCLRNFRIAAGEEQGEFTGMVFQDSDLGKWLEAVAYSLNTAPDADLERTADEVIALMARAQRPDGYLDTYFIVKEPRNRWKNIRDCHELYCAGHLLEAAVAYYRATGKRQFLDVMCRYMDYILTVFGTEPGRIPGYPGHEELELALCKLYDVTGEKKYLDLAKYFIDQRGQQPLFFIEELKTRGDTFHWDNNDGYDLRYFQAHQPVRDQQDAVGHAVRAVYLYTGMADVALRTDDEELKAACRRLFRSIADKRMYITGAIGSTHEGEAFTFDYDLPNDTAYAETCASIGLIFFMKRMLQMDHDAIYADVMERALYNTVLAGMGLDGKAFFYVNPLEMLPEACREDPGKHHVKPERQKWFACACCPPNVARLLSDLGEYIYQQDGHGVTVNLFIGSRVQLDGMVLTQESGVPFDGHVKLTVACEGEKPAVLRVRKPFWAGDVTASLPYTEDKGYLVFDRVWRDGDALTLDFEMPIRRVYANPLVRQDLGKVALMRGPLVYCLEQADNGPNLHLLTLPQVAPISCTTLNGAPLTGLPALTAPGARLVPSGAALYTTRPAFTTAPATLTFIPYFAWANRGLGEMTVWVRE